MEEKLRILKLLEEGKINAEEAARLLEALSHWPGWEHRPHFIPEGVIPDPEKIFETVSSAVASVLGKRKAAKELKFTGKKELQLKTIQGDISVTGHEGLEIIIRSQGKWLEEVSEQDDRVVVKNVSGDIEVTAPKEIGLRLAAVSGDISINNCQGETEISAVSGDINIENCRGTVRIKTVSGDVKSKNLCAQLEGETKTGNIDLDFSEIAQADLKTEMGDVEIRIPQDSSLKVELVAEAGDILCDLPLTKEERKLGYVSGTLGDGKGHLRVKTAEGDIKISKKEG